MGHWASGVLEMAKHEGVVIHIVKELEAVAFGKLRNNESVFVCTPATNAGCDKSLDGSLEKKYVVGVIKPNDDLDPVRRKRSPWVCINVNDMSDEEAFNSSTPPSIKDDDEVVNGNGKKREMSPPSPPGKEAVNEALYYLVYGKVDLMEDLNSLEARAKVARQLLDEGEDPADNFSTKLETRIKQLKDEQREQARFEVAAALRDLEIAELILAHDGTTPEATDDSGEKNPYETTPGVVAAAAG